MMRHLSFLVARYWDEEAGLDLSEKMPWRRWLSMQPDHIAERYGKQEDRS